MKVEIEVTFNEEQKKEIIEKCMEMLNTTDCTILDVYVLWEEEQKEEIISLCEEKFNEELEKIKEEIQDFDLASTNGNSAKNVFLLTRDLSVSVIDKHISELKGENNEL